MKSKYGIVILLDALGARTASIAASEAYLKAIRDIKTECVNARNFTVDGPKRHDPDVHKQFQAMIPHFFGDSLLMACSLHKREELCRYIDRVSFIISILIAKALDMGILFRGAVSVGEYIERSGIILGPAITDVASWYDAAEMIGVICTPSCTTRIKSAYRNKIGAAYDESATLAAEIFQYDVPTKRGPLRTYTVNWPYAIAAYKGKEDDLQWYYDRVARLDIPLGTESKYSNTEAFVKYALTSKK